MASRWVHRGAKRKHRRGFRLCSIASHVVRADECSSAICGGNCSVKRLLGCKRRLMLKGTRWLLLMEGSDARSTRRSGCPPQADQAERPRLRCGVEANEPLATAYYQGEAAAVLDRSDRQAASVTWKTGVQAESSGIRVLHTMANTLRTHRAGLLARYDHPISTGPLEGANNKIKLLQHRARLPQPGLLPVENPHAPSHQTPNSPDDTSTHTFPRRAVPTYGVRGPAVRHHRPSRPAHQCSSWPSPSLRRTLHLTPLRPKPNSPGSAESLAPHDPRSLDLLYLARASRPKSYNIRLSPLGVRLPSVNYAAASSGRPIGPNQRQNIRSALRL